MSEVIHEVQCLVCPGLIDRVPAAQARAVAAEHLARWHRGVDPATGPHHTTHPAARVCDACLTIVEVPYWAHTSTPPTPAAGQDDTDSTWLLCDRCHQLHAAGALVPWAAHAWRTGVQRAPWMARMDPAAKLDSRTHLADVLRTLLERLDDGAPVTVHAV